MDTITQNQDHPAWMTAQEFSGLLEKHKSLDLCETDSISEPGKKLEFLITPPSDVCYSASLRYMTNAKENTNDVMEMQKVFYQFCYVKGESGLQKELDDAATSSRQIMAIGRAVGEAYPIPEARLKKTFRKA